MFNVDFRKLVSDLLPPRRRKLRHIDWLQALTSPVRGLHKNFTALMEQKRYELTFNSQVIYLEYLLNQRFNKGLSTITIEDGLKAEGTYLYNEAEEQDAVYVFNENEQQQEVYLHNDSEFAAECDFVVLVPNTLSFDTSEMRALINYYRAAGKLFLIKTYPQ